jgi:hypothetical protein
MMDKYLLRNDPCYCGSGKEYMICHMVSHWPKEYFDVPINPSAPRGSVAVTFRNGKWEEMPGISLGMSLEIVDSKYVYDDINDVIRELSNKLFSQQDRLRLNHKLSAIRYHSDNFKREEEDQIKRFRTSITGGESVDIVEQNPKIIFEFEAFLFQVKSCLDVFNRLIRTALKLPLTHTYSRGGEDMIQSLKNNCPKNLKLKAAKLISIMESNKKWILHEVEMRNEITHVSNLVGFECFNQQARSGNYFIRIYFPSMLNGKRVKTYIDEIWKKLLSFIKEIIMEIVN